MKGPNIHQEPKEQEPTGDQFLNLLAPITNALIKQTNQSIANVHLLL